MVQVSEICRRLEELAPRQLAEPWDNVGLLLGRSTRQVERILTCLTLTASVAEEAIRRGSQMIVTHHPILFRGTKQITDLSIEGKLILSLAEAGIAVHSPHTAFDSAAQGINQLLAESMGLTNIQPLRVLEQIPESGPGRWGILETPRTRDAFLSTVTRITKASYLETSWNGPDTVTRVAVACGAAAEFLEDAAKKGCDTFVTGEARFHSVLECQARGLNLVLTGHFHSERPAVEQLAEWLGRAFPELECAASESDRNPLALYTPRNPGN